MRRKLTDIDLVAELTELNDDGSYDALIEKAKTGYYHDFKHPPGIEQPKVQLVKDLRRFPELSEILTDVLNCEYDEKDNVDEQEISDVNITLID
jgi:hypothetical protein